MITLTRASRRGFLLIENMIAMSIFSAISLALIMGFISLERSLTATTNFATNHTDAMRISDYLALDLRRALRITLPGPTATPTPIPGVPKIVATIVIPAYYNAEGGPQTPQLDGSGGVSYGSSGSQEEEIVYSLLNGTMYRQEGSAPALGIADNVSDFVFTVTDLGKVVTTKITFKPTFTSQGASQAAIEGTAVFNTTLLRNSRTEPSATPSG